MTATHERFLCVHHLLHLHNHYLKQQAWATRGVCWAADTSGLPKDHQHHRRCGSTQATVAGYMTSYSRPPRSRENGTTTRAQSTQPAHRDIHRTRLQHCCRAHRQGTRELGEAQHNTLTTEGRLPRHCVRPHAWILAGNEDVNTSTLTASPGTHMSIYGGSTSCQECCRKEPHWSPLEAGRVRCWRAQLRTSTSESGDPSMSYNEPHTHPWINTPTPSTTTHRSHRPYTVDPRNPVRSAGRVGVSTEGQAARVQSSLPSF